MGRLAMRQEARITRAASKERAGIRVSIVRLLYWLAVKAKEPRLVSEKAGIERVSRALGAHRRARAVLHVDTADGCGGLVRAFASANRATWIRARAEWDGLAVFSAARPLASGLCVHSIHAASMRIAIQLGNRKTDKFRAGSLRKVIRL